MDDKQQHSKYGMPTDVRLAADKAERDAMRRRELKERKEQVEQLAALREPIPDGRIGKLPKTTCKNCRDGACNQHEKERCGVCDAWISTQHIHIDFVGHAVVTERLLEVDDQWTWEPLAYDDHGLPAITVSDRNVATMWIKLTVAGVTRIEVGSCKAFKDDMLKELVGDAIRRAAMRFGVALNMWAKSDLHAVDEPGAFAVETISEDAVTSIREVFDDVDKADRKKVMFDWVKTLEQPVSMTPKHEYAAVYESASAAVKAWAAAPADGLLAQARQAVKDNPRLTLKMLEVWSAARGYGVGDIKLTKGKVAAVVALASASGLTPSEVAADAQGRG